MDVESDSDRGTPEPVRWLVDEVCPTLVQGADEV